MSATKLATPLPVVVLAHDDDGDGDSDGVELPPPHAERIMAAENMTPSEYLLIFELFDSMKPPRVEMHSI